MTDNTDENTIIEAMQACADEHGKCTPRLFSQHDNGYSVRNVQDTFDSWSAAKQKGGLETEERNGKGYSDEQLLSHLKIVEREKGKVTPETMQDVDDVAVPSTVISRFGSWSNAKKQAEITPDERVNNTAPREFDDEDYHELLRECKEKHGRLSRRLFDQFRDEIDKRAPHSTAVAKRFGSWDAAKEAAGLPTNDTKPSEYDPEDLLVQLRACQDKHGKCSARVFQNDSEFASPQTVTKHFDSWNVAKKEAGVTSNGTSYSDDELLDLLRECYEKHGKCSMTVFGDDDAFPHPNTVVRRFGTWTNAKEEANLVASA